MAANDNNTKTYATKASAKRGAERAGIERPVFFATEEGVTVRDALSFSHKELDRLAPARSQKEKPVDIVWNFVQANPDMTRKETIAHLVSLGLNVNMCRTQYHRCKSGWVRSKKIAAIIGA